MTITHLATWLDIEHEFTRLTYRIVYHWITNDAIAIARRAHGSGNQNGFSGLDIRRLRVLDKIHSELAVTPSGGSRRHHTEAGVPVQWVEQVWKALAREPWPTRLVLIREPQSGRWSLISYIRADQSCVVVPIPKEHP